MVAYRSFGTNRSDRYQPSQHHNKRKGVFGHMIVRLCILSACFSIFIVPLSARGERIWAAALKPFLPEQELSHAEVFLTEEQALKIMLQKSERIRQDVIR